MTTWSTVYTHDNGGRPFEVEFLPNKIRISKKVYSDTEDMEFYKYVPLMTVNKYEKIFETKPLPAKEQKIYGIFDPGNAVLIQLPKKGGKYQYMFIGYKIVIFKTTHPVKKFYSPIGNSDVPYTFAETDDTTYLLTENVYIKNKDLKYNKSIVDAYGLYYGKMKELERKAKPIKYEVIQERLY